MELSASLSYQSLPVPPQWEGAVCQPAPQLWRPSLSPVPCCQISHRSAAQKSPPHWKRAVRVPPCNPSWKEESSDSPLFLHRRPGEGGRTPVRPSSESWEELKKGQRSRVPTPLLSKQPTLAGA